MSEKPEHNNHDEEHPPQKVTAGRRLTNYFLTGLVIAAPVGLTLYITWSIIRFVDDFVKPLIPPQYNPDTYLPISIPGFGLVIGSFALIMLGFLTANLVGRTLVQFGESILHKMPFVSVLYRGLKQIFETVVSQSHSNFKQVGLIEYPRHGLYALVFISTEAKGEVAEKVTGEDITSVFLPTTPNPTSGFLLFLPRSEVHILDMSVEDGAKLVISAGLVSPEYQTKIEELAEKTGIISKKK
ncbi:DUF502 domain-containing protein [Maritalea sp.]|jgi:uncharacterized membrane protein|uniref:DUF502 domain-containing protein n=1 Tax=Maritalea sp. TaxID=2003361 RepID=UPI0039E665C2